MNDMEFDPSEFPIAYIVWRDHSATMCNGSGPWMSLKDALENSGPVLVHEVGFVLRNTEDEIILASCLSVDEGTKGVSTILPECVEEFIVLKGEVDGD